PPMHRHRRIRQQREFVSAAAMIGVSMSIDNQIELQPMIGKHAEVTLDSVLERIDDNRALGALRSQQVGLTLRVVQLAENHVPSCAAGRERLSLRRSNVRRSSRTV